MVCPLRLHLFNQRDLRKSLAQVFLRAVQIGSKRFNAQIAEMLERRVAPGAPGRPRKEKPKLAQPEIHAG